MLPTQVPTHRGSPEEQSNLSSVTEVGESLHGLELSSGSAKFPSPPPRPFCKLLEDRHGDLLISVTSSVSMLLKVRKKERMATKEASTACPA